MYNLKHGFEHYRPDNGTVVQGLPLQQCHYQALIMEQHEATLLTGL